MTPFQYKRRDNNRNLIYMCVVDRTTYVEETLEEIKQGKIRLPMTMNHLIGYSSVV